MARPRKPHRTEACPCYKLIGFRLTKTTPYNSYYYFRHDDRQFRCPDCNSLDCYIDDILKKQDFKNHQFYEEIKYFQNIAEHYNSLITTVKKYKLALETCPLPVNDPGQFERAYATINPFLEFCKLIDFVLEGQCTISKAILEGKEKELPRDYLDEYHGMIKLIQKYSGHNPKEFLRRLAEPAFKEFRNIDLNYLRPVRNLKKEIMRRKVIVSKNKPPNLLGPSYKEPSKPEEEFWFPFMIKDGRPIALVGAKPYKNQRSE